MSAQLHKMKIDLDFSEEFDRFQQALGRAVFREVHSKLMGIDDGWRIRLACCGDHSMRTEPLAIELLLGQGHDAPCYRFDFEEVVERDLGADGRARLRVAQALRQLADRLEGVGDSDAH